MKSENARQTEIFQSTLPRGSDAHAVHDTIEPLKFQSTLPRGSDTGSVFVAVYCNNFNPRSLAGATVLPLLLLLIMLVFQSTLPRGSDGFRHAAAAASEISIHAPSRERPAGYNLFRSPILISIHAPSRERHKSMSGIETIKLFQSTLPRGSDIYLDKLLIEAGISIHAPSRERHSKTIHLAKGRISIHAPSRERHRYVSYW